MTFRRIFLVINIVLVFCVVAAFGQADSVIGQMSSSGSETFAGGISGDGRFVVFESRGNIATENPRNADGNTEIFLFDYAQRRIFQITDTKAVLFDTTKLPTFDNVRIEITNTRPVISNNGRWIAFSSNATTSTPLVPDATNPGSFDGNAFTSPTPTPSPTPTVTPTPTATPTPAANPLSNDANLEIWLYEIPAYAAVPDLSEGDEIALAQLAGGTFTRVTNTNPSQLPRTATATTGAFIADDNHDATISDDGNTLAFVSTRDLVPPGNPTPLPTPTGPAEDNDEIFTYVRGLGTLGQVTRTLRGPIGNPIYNKNPTISGNGARVAFASTGDDPIDDPSSATNFDTGSNPASSRNEEVFYADLAAGLPTGGKQITTTTPTNPGDPVNILDLGRRMSRDGRFIAFDSYADLATTPNGANSAAFATYVYDATASTFKQIGLRSAADTAALGGDVQRYPGFTDYDGAGTPRTLVLETRMNIKNDGTIPTTAADGLNNDEVRPAQIYSFPLDVPTTLPPTTPGFTRLARFPAPRSFIASTQLLPSNSIERMAFNLALTELGFGNFDQLSEVFYFIKPTVENQSPISISLATGASRMPVTLTALPSPTASPTPPASPTPTPTPTPTPSPTASPTGTPTPTPTPTATPTPPSVTPPAVFGIAPGMLAILDYQAGIDRPVVARTAVGSLERRFNLPIELSGVSMTINGVACGLKSVSRHRIEFVVPPQLSSAGIGTTYPLVINNNGILLKTTVVIVPARPDIFNKEMLIGPFGRAKLFNVTNTVFTTEPFAVRTILRRGNKLVPSVLRLYITGTGAANILPSNFSIKIRDSVISGVAIRTGSILVDPGVYTVDFELPAQLQGAGDQPIVFTVTFDGGTFSSRLEDTAPRLRIL